MVSYNLMSLWDPDYLNEELAMLAFEKDMCRKQLVMGVWKRAYKVLTNAWCGSCDGVMPREALWSSRKIFMAFSLIMTCERYK